jgi:protein-L-isoaspartate O-methyltransferase
MVASDIRQRYAEEIRTNTHLTSPDLLKAFAAVPREDFVGSGPWKVLSRVPGQMQSQVADVTDPAELYRDVAILLDPSRSLTNGNPGTLAPWVDALNLSAGKSVFHLGCATGYYTAIMAEMVGPKGRITAVEIDPALAAQARANLSRYSNVEVVQPPITMATRLATFAMVPVKRLWMAVKPVSNGDPPCARAATGMRKSRARTAAVGRAHFDRRRGWTVRTRWTWNRRDDICASRSS